MWLFFVLDFKTNTAETDMVFYFIGHRMKHEIRSKERLEVNS